MPLLPANPRPQQTPEEFLTGAPAAPASAGRFLRFFVWLFAIPVLLYLSVIPLVLLPSYEQWGPSHWGPMLEFAFHTEGQNADVVVFGDSSAFLGVDPRLVNRQLGVRSLVLPNTLGSLPVMGEQPLDFYLAHNRKPRLIVLYFTAWDLNYGAASSSRLYEGEEMLLRHGTWGQIAGFAFRHPLELPAFPLRNLSTVGPGILKQMASGRSREKDTADALGHADDTENYPPLAQPCTLPARDLDAQQSGTVRDLASRYRARGYQVAVYLAPLPDCVGANTFSGQTYGGLVLAPAVTLPPASFKQDGYYAHLEPESVAAASKLFADAIAPLVR